MAATARSQLEFLRIAGQLKRTPRTGWVRSGVQQVESVAEHMHRMALCCLILDEPGVDPGRAALVAVCHDLAEAVVGDITPHDPVSKEEKAALEWKAITDMAALLGGDSKAAERIMGLYREYEQQSTPEGRLCKDIDKAEMLLQALDYEREALLTAQRAAAPAAPSAHAAAAVSAPQAKETQQEHQERQHQYHVIAEQDPDLNLSQFYASVPSSRIKSPAVAAWVEEVMRQREQLMQERQQLRAKTAESAGSSALPSASSVSSSASLPSSAAAIAPAPVAASSSSSTWTGATKGQQEAEQRYRKGFLHGIAAAGAVGTLLLGAALLLPSLLKKRG